MAIYKIVYQFNGLVLDVPGFSRDPGALIHQFTDNGGANQRWELIPVGGQAFAHFWIKSRSSGLLLALEHYNVDNETKIQQAADDGALQQRWHFALVNADGITFIITNVGSGLVLDVPAFSLATEGPESIIEQYRYHGGTNQHWQLIRVS